MKINTDKNCNIVIFDDTEYSKYGLEYSETASLYIAQLNKSNSSTIIYSNINPHINTTGESIILEPQTGGYITFCHVILPKVENIEDYNPELYIEKYVRARNYIRLNQISDLFHDSSSSEEEPPLEQEEDSYQIIGGYFTDGQSIYYKNIEGITRKVEIQEVLEVNPEVFGIIKIYQNFFSVCYLRKCFISLCQKIFNDRGFDRCFNGKVDSQLIYKRDLVWAALNVIQYMIDSNQLAEAQRLLERIMGCNGLCSSEDTGDKGCGCER